MIDLVNNVVSNLKSIFNAIKRAEDAVNSQATPVSYITNLKFLLLLIFSSILILIPRFIVLQKLHVLADFGLSFAKALGNTSAPNSQSPIHVLLPSSLYKNRTSEKRKASLKPRLANSYTRLIL